MISLCLINSVGGEIELISHLDCCLGENEPS